MRPLIAVFLFGVSSHAQEYRKHNVQVDMGAAMPRGELREVFSESFFVGAGYGYRFHEFFQADIGFDTAFGAAGVKDFVPTFAGNLRIRDYQHFLPFGGRAIIPIARDRVLIYGGGGGAYMRYSERISQPFTDGGFRFDCDVCSSRDGIGYYGLFGVDVALDRGRNFRLGVGGRVIRGQTEGDPFGGVPPRETQDRWINVFGRFTFSF